MEALALPFLALALASFALLGIWVSVRNPPRFWMDEKRIPDRGLNVARRRILLRKKT